MEPNLVLQAFALLVTLGFQTFAIVRYLIDRMDRKIEAERNAREEEMKTLTTRNEFDKHVEHVDRQFAHVREDIKANNTSVMAAINGLSNTLTNRLDNLMLTLGSRNDNKKS